MIWCTKVGYYETDDFGNAVKYTDNEAIGNYDQRLVIVRFSNHITDWYPFRVTGFNSDRVTFCCL